MATKPAIGWRAGLGYTLGRAGGWMVVVALVMPWFVHGLSLAALRLALDTLLVAMTLMLVAQWLAPTAHRAWVGLLFSLVVMAGLDLSVRLAAAG